MIDEIEFDWEVLEVFNDPEKRGVQVLYTPIDAAMSAIEVFVPVPFHKCTDQAHAEEIMGKKITQRAPRNRWMKEITPPAPDVSAEVTENLKAEIRNGGKRGQKRNNPGNANTGRSQGGNTVS